MVTSKKTLEKIREIIEKHYARITIGVLGKSVYSARELKQLKDLGVDATNDDSMLEMIYNHNFINNPRTVESPHSVGEMKNQQSMPNLVPKGEANDYTIENLNDKTRQLIDKMRMDMTAKIEGIVRGNNDRYKFDALQNLTRDDMADQMVKESSLGRVKQMLRDTSKDANRDWQRVALTEMSNAIGVGSVDRIVTDNRDADLDDIYVYRIPVNDNVTCKYCRRFYGDAGQTPKIYRLSTLLANGSNYGKKSDDWRPVVGATHPNTRTSQILELRPGFIVKPGGQMTYVGLEEWKEWIMQNLIA